MVSYILCKLETPMVFAITSQAPLSTPIVFIMVIV
jgi:hypothetical protein